MEAKCAESRAFRRSAEGQEGVIDVLAGSGIEFGGAERYLEAIESQDADSGAPAEAAGLTGRVQADRKAGWTWCCW